MTELETTEQQALMVIETKRDALLSQTPILEVIDAQSEATAAKFLSDVKDKEREIEDFIKSWTKPLEDQKKRWFAVRNNLLAPILPIKKTLEDALIGYRRQLVMAAQKEEARLRALQEKRMERATAAGRPPPIPVAVTPYVPVPDKTTNGLTYTESWEAVIEDISRIPTFFNETQILFPSMSVLNQMARLQKGQNPPPGIAFKQKIGTRVSK